MLSKDKWEFGNLYFAISSSLSTQQSHAKLIWDLKLAISLMENSLNLN